MNLDRLKYRYWQHTDWHDTNSPLEAVYCNAVDGCDPTIAVSDFEFCTGLKDKNGNLIYEGDVVRGEKEIGTVKYGKHPRTNSHSIELGFYIDWEMKHPWRSDICYWTSPENPDCIEIIGNIHEQAKQKE